MPNGASVGAGGIGTLSLLALFPPARAEIAQRYFTLDISDETANGVLYYGLACIILCGLPFNLLGILGTRRRCLIVCCLVSSVIVSLHLVIIWIASLICTVAIDANIREHR